jgi:hypothetical protein
VVSNAKGKKKPLECFPFKIIKLTQLSISHELYYYCFPMLNPMDFNGEKKSYISLIVRLLVGLDFKILSLGD